MFLDLTYSCRTLFYDTFDKTLLHVILVMINLHESMGPGRDRIPGVASSIPARSHTFVEIDHEIISAVILLPSADSFKKGCCQLQAKVCARITGYPLVQACPGKSVVR